MQWRLWMFFVSLTWSLHDIMASGFVFLWDSHACDMCVLCVCLCVYVFLLWFFFFYLFVLSCSDLFIFYCISFYFIIILWKPQRVWIQMGVGGREELERVEGGGRGKRN